ncbi:uncharacterized protein K460DRAFT_171102 [Cucurbitaria berberidis CBS 394.84]|uniref:Uncharacterized protein n=1 Tax=Cucurbitaria berberidis CBS 394.84 TaxID=1168544 RepID=A0A9P4GAH5_9PLEO|nr:uncharacterized protein K460DRAFT_171102 [Cucurbitaria berberidis CBS 394.84]KAF1841675.1 hypothetical protein K460DRAFT_171102 [Cucurbitaria berberidis CBS 394.84]
MGVANPPVSTVNMLQELVYTILDVFNATRDLYQTLETKEKRDYQLVLQSKGYPTSRRIEYVEDGRLGSDEALVMDKVAVSRQFENGYQALGAQFAMGDGEYYSLTKLARGVKPVGPTASPSGLPLLVDVHFFPFLVITEFPRSNPKLKSKWVAPPSPAGVSGYASLGSTIAR